MAGRRALPAIRGRMPGQSVACFAVIP